LIYTVINLNEPHQASNLQYILGCFYSRVARVLPGRASNHHCHGSGNKSLCSVPTPILIAALLLVLSLVSPIKIYNKQNQGDGITAVLLHSNCAPRLFMVVMTQYNFTVETSSANGIALPTKH
jgi:hypothetical protein